MLYGAVVVFCVKRSPTDKLAAKNKTNAMCQRPSWPWRLLAETELEAVTLAVPQRGFEKPTFVEVCYLCMSLMIGSQTCNKILFIILRIVY